MRFHRWSLVVLGVAALLVLNSLGRAEAGDLPSGTDVPTLTVTGAAPVVLTTIPPDPNEVKDVYLQLSGTGDTYKAANQALLARAATAEKALAAFGLVASTNLASAISGDAYMGWMGPPPMHDGDPAYRPDKPQARLSATLKIPVRSREQVLTAMQVGMDSGALSASTEPLGPGSHTFYGGPPALLASTAELSNAIKQATANAKDLAANQARAAGITLGRLRTIHTEPPQVWCQDCQQVTVTLTYDVVESPAHP